MKKQYLECGKIVSTHGVVGEVKIQPWCDSPEDMESLKKLYFDNGATVLKVEKIRIHKSMVLLKLEGVNNPQEAQNLRGRVVYLDRNDLSLEEGEYFIQDLIGLEVIDADDGHLYGKLCDVTETGANDVYHITFPDGSVKLAPVIPQVIIETDIEAGFVKIRPLKGLFEDEN